MKLEERQYEMRERIRRESDKALAGELLPTEIMIDIASERHYTVQEIAKLWHLHSKTVHRLFDDQPGVLEFGREEGRFKRPYRSRRIPESVMIRVHRDLRTV